MIRTMYQFGLHLREIEEMKTYFEIFAAPYSKKATEEIVIIAEIKNRHFQKLTIEPYKNALDPKYLFREPDGPNATSIIPTLKFFFSDKSIDEANTKFLGKLNRCINANKKIYEKYFDCDEMMASLRSEWKDFVNNLHVKPQNHLFTLRIDDKLIGEISEIVTILEKKSYDKYFRESIGHNHICSASYQVSQEVWGRVNTLGFTVEKIAFSRNGFEAKDSYKMFPVSPDSVKILEGTMRVLSGPLSFNFSNLKFFILPHFITLGDDIIQKKNIARRFISKITEVEAPGFSPLLKSIINSETIFDNIINDAELGKNSIYYDIFFYEEKQAQFAIKLHVSDVLPSRFRQIQYVKEKVTTCFAPITFKEFKNKDTFTFSPNFYNIKDYFAIKREKETIIEPYFFKIVEAVFYKNRINEEQVLQAFMQKIVPAFKNASNNSYAFTDHVKHSFCIHQFFQQLQLFGNMEPSTGSDLHMKAFDFIDQHEAFFKNKIQKAAFLLGCSVEVLLGSQRSYLNGNEPFSKRLNNLSVDYRELQRIKTELLSKVKQYAEAKKLYNSTYIYELLSEFDKLMMSGDDPSLSKTQVSYAFSVGLVMEKEFAKVRKNQKEVREKSQETEN